MSIIRGFVVDGSGRGIADQEVMLRGSNADRDRFRSVRFNSEDRAEVVRMYLGVRRARTDDDGHFSFADLAPGSYGVGVTPPGASQEVSSQITVAKDASLEDVRIVLPGG